MIRHSVRRNMRTKLLTLEFLVLLLTVVTSIFMSTAVKAEIQYESETLTFSDLGIGSKTFTSGHGAEVKGTVGFEITIDDYRHNRYAVHLHYMVGSDRPQQSIELVITINEEYTIRGSIFRFIERGSKHWRHIELPYKHFTDGVNTVSITIILASSTNEFTTFTWYADSSFEMAKTVLIQSAGTYSSSILGVLPSTSYEDELLVTGIFGGSYSTSYTPQLEFYLQGNMTSVDIVLELSLETQVPSDCTVTYNLYVNTQPLFEEEQSLESNEVTIQQSLTELPSGRNTIQLQCHIEQYRVAGGGASGKAYTFLLKVNDNSRLIFSGVGDSVIGSDSTLGDLGTLPFGLLTSLMFSIPVFLVIVYKFRGGFGKEKHQRRLSCSDTHESGRMKTLRVREND